MSTDLEKATASNGVMRASDGLLPAPGAGLTTADATFEKRGYTYDADMPTAFRKGAAQSTALSLRKQGTTSAALARFSDATPLKSDLELAKIAAQSIASGARQLEKPRRAADGRIVQRRVGWRATPMLILIATAERELIKGADGRLRPAGEWLLEHRKTYRNTSGAAKKRTGLIPVREEAPIAMGPSIPATPPPGADSADAFSEGEFALSFLPPSVRSSVRARIPSPTVFDGTLLQYSTGDVLDRYEVNLIRMDEAHAVVVQASRAPDATHWDVSQAAYTLHVPEIEQA